MIPDEKRMQRRVFSLPFLSPVDSVSYEGSQILSDLVACPQSSKLSFYLWLSWFLIVLRHVYPVTDITFPTQFPCGRVKRFLKNNTQNKMRVGAKGGFPHSLYSIEVPSLLVSIAPMLTLLQPPST